MNKVKMVESGGGVGGGGLLHKLMARTQVSPRAFH